MPVASRPNRPHRSDTLLTGQQIKAARILAELEQCDLARAAGVSRNLVSLFERRKTVPRETAGLLKITGALRTYGVEIVETGLLFCERTASHIASMKVEVAPEPEAAPAEATSVKQVATIEQLREMLASLRSSRSAA